MAGEDRTKAATPRKLQHLRDEGKVSKSPEVISALSILGGVLTIYMFGSSIWGQLHTLLVDGLTGLSRPDLNDTSLGQLWMTDGMAFFSVMAPLLVAMPLIGV